METIMNGLYADGRLISRSFSLNEVDSSVLVDMSRSLNSVSTSHLLSRTRLRLALHRISSFLDDISHDGDSGIKNARSNAITGIVALKNANLSQSNNEPIKYSNMTPARIFTMTSLMRCRYKTVVMRIKNKSLHTQRRSNRRERGQHAAQVWL